MRMMEHILRPQSFGWTLPLSQPSSLRNWISLSSSSPLWLIWLKPVGRLTCFKDNSLAYVFSQTSGMLPIPLFSPSKCFLTNCCFQGSNIGLNSDALPCKPTQHNLQNGWQILALEILNSTHLVQSNSKKVALDMSCIQMYEATWNSSIFRRNHTTPDKVTKQPLLSSELSNKYSS